MGDPHFQLPTEVGTLDTFLGEVNQRPSLFERIVALRRRKGQRVKRHGPGEGRMKVRGIPFLLLGK